MATLMVRHSCLSYIHFYLYMVTTLSVAPTPVRSIPQAHAHVVQPWTSQVDLQMQVWQPFLQHGMSLGPCTDSYTDISWVF